MEFIFALIFVSIYIFTGYKISTPLLDQIKTRHKHLLKKLNNKFYYLKKFSILEKEAKQNIDIYEEYYDYFEMEPDPEKLIKNIEHEALKKHSKIKIKYYLTMTIFLPIILLFVFFDQKKLEDWIYKDVKKIKTKKIKESGRIYSVNLTDEYGIEYRIKEKGLHRERGKPAIINLFSLKKEFYIKNKKYNQKELGKVLMKEKLTQF